MAGAGSVDRASVGGREKSIWLWAGVEMEVSELGEFQMMQANGRQTKRKQPERKQTP